MEKEKQKEIINTTVKVIKDSINIREVLGDFGMSPESDIVSSLSSMEEGIIQLAEEALGPEWRQWLYWFIYENSCGEREYEVTVGYGKETFRVKTVDDIIRAVEHTLH